jgi:hypothetical protein
MEATAAAVAAVPNHKSMPPTDTTPSLREVPQGFTIVDLCAQMFRGRSRSSYFALPACDDCLAGLLVVQFGRDILERVVPVMFALLQELDPSKCDEADGFTFALRESLISIFERLERGKGNRFYAAFGFNGKPGHLMFFSGDDLCDKVAAKLTELGFPTSLQEKGAIA